MNKQSKLLWLLLFLLPLESIAQNVESRLKEANVYYQNLEYDAAIQSYRSILMEEEVLLAKVRLAEMYYKKNNDREAEFWYQQLIELPDAQPVWFLFYAGALYGNGKCRLANEWLNRYKGTSEGMYHWFLNYNCNPINIGKQPNEMYKIEQLPFSSNGYDYYPMVRDNRLIFLMDNSLNLKHWKLPKTPNIFYSTIETIDAINHEYTYDRSPEPLIRRNEKYDLYQNEGIKAVLQKYIGDVVPLESLNVMYPTFTADSNRLYLEMNLVGGFGGMDLYYMDKEDGVWSPPWNMGPEINTAGDEVFPYWESTTQQLYFSSNGHGGFGGLDIYSVKQKEGAWQYVVNMGKPLNSDADDFGAYVNAKGDFGYFSSNRMHREGCNIYSFKRQYKPVKVKIIDAQRQAILAEVEIYNECLNFGLLSSEVGEATIDIPNKDCCTFTISKKGYLKKEVEFCGTDNQNNTTIELRKQ